MDPKPLTILQLQASNVKRLRAVNIRPDGQVVVLGGKNGAGKSSVLDAITYALAGERAAALAALTQAIDLGIRDPLLGRDPAFADLRDDAAFQAQVTRMIELINAERAKLDMAPLQ